MNKKDITEDDIVDAIVELDDEKASTLFVIAGFIVLSVLILIILVHSPMGTWECVEWGTSSTEGHYEKIADCYQCITKYDNLIDIMERDETCDKELVKKWIDYNECEKITEHKYSSWVGDKVCIKEQLIREV